MHETTHSTEAFEFVLDMQIKFAVGHRTYGNDKNDASQSTSVFLFSVSRKTFCVIIVPYNFDANGISLGSSMFKCFG